MRACSMPCNSGRTCPSFARRTPKVATRPHSRNTSSMRAYSPYIKPNLRYPATPCVCRWGRTCLRNRSARAASAACLWPSIAPLDAVTPLRFCRFAACGTFAKPNGNSTCSRRFPSIRRSFRSSISILLAGIIISSGRSPKDRRFPITSSEMGRSPSMMRFARCKKPPRGWRSAMRIKSSTAC